MKIIILMSGLSAFAAFTTSVGTNILRPAKIIQVKKIASLTMQEKKMLKDFVEQKLAGSDELASKQLLDLLPKLPVKIRGLMTGLMKEKLLNPKAIAARIKNSVEYKNIMNVMELEKLTRDEKFALTYFLTQKMAGNKELASKSLVSLLPKLPMLMKDSFKRLMTVKMTKAEGVKLAATINNMNAYEEL